MKHVTVAETTFMDAANSKSTAELRGRPTHQMLVSFSAAYFVGALVTDGLIVAGLAVIAYVIDLAGGKQIAAPAWPRAIGYAVAVVLSLINAFVHSRDGYTAVVPTGLMLSGLVVVVLLLTAWVARASANPHRVGG